MVRRSCIAMSVKPLKEVILISNTVLVFGRIRLDTIVCGTCTAFNCIYGMLQYEYGVISCWCIACCEVERWGLGMVV